jgi:adenine phosphoribosyltransferase
MPMKADVVRNAIRDIPDFPKPGIIFKDVTPVLRDTRLFRGAVGLLAETVSGNGIHRIAAIDARGFLFGAALAERLRIGLVPIRKKGKLPYQTFEESYDLEYGSATIAIHQDAFETGESVLLIDDLLATGGTAAAAVKLIEKAGGRVAQISFLVELSFLNGRGKLAGYQVSAPIVY